MPKLKTIAFYCTSSSFGGLEINTVKLAKWLVEQKLFKVVMLGLEDSPIMKLAQDMGMPIAYTRRYSKHLDIRGVLNLRRALRSNCIDVVFTAYNKDLSALALLKNVLRNKVKVVYQQQMDLVINKKDIVHTLRYAAIDIWIAPLEGIKRDVLRNTRVPSRKIRVIPLGIDCAQLLSKKKDKQVSLQQLQLSPVHPLLGIMGRIDRHKGQLLLLQALQMLRERDINAEVLIVGEPTRGEEQGQSYMNSIKDFIYSHELENRVHMRPFMQDVETFYSAIDIFVMATIRETYGMVTGEAMIYGLPIVGSNAGGTVDLLAEYNGYQLFKTCDAKDLADKLQLLLTNLEQNQQQAQRAAQNAVHFFSHVEECNMIASAINALF